MKNHQIVQLFELADEAKQCGNYAIADCVFASLFEASPDNPGISYLYETDEHSTESLREEADELDDANAYYDLLVLSYAARTICIPFPLVNLKMARQFAKIAIQRDRQKHTRCVRKNLNTPSQQQYLKEKLTSIHPEWKKDLRKWLRLPTQGTSHFSIEGGQPLMLVGNHLTSEVPPYWQYVS